MNAPARNDDARRQPGIEADQKQLNPNDTSTANQIAIVEAALRDGPKSTVELRYEYGIMHPAGRVQDLRAMGYLIDTVRIASYTPDGIRHHSIAKYNLQAESSEVAL